MITTWRDDFGRLVAECRVCTEDMYPNPYNEVPEEGHICEDCEGPQSPLQRTVNNYRQQMKAGEIIREAMTYSPRVR